MGIQFKPNVYILKLTKSHYFLVINCDQSSPFCNSRVNIFKLLFFVFNFLINVQSVFSNNKHLF